MIYTRTKTRGLYTTPRLGSPRFSRRRSASHFVMKLWGWEADAMFRPYAIVDKRDRDPA